MLIALLFVGHFLRDHFAKMSPEGLVAATQAEGQGGWATMTLPEARRGFNSKLNGTKQGHEPVPEAPHDVFLTIKYPTLVGSIPAYLSPDPGDGRKRPAILWITGGDCNSIGEVWNDADPSNDQTAAAYRKAGIVMMFPSLRGGNQNPGPKEGFLGEVDDIMNALDYLVKQPYVDPSRVYLGGHSTGGTLVMLAAASTNRFRAVFSFGPVESVYGYGPDSEYLPFNALDPKEIAIRSPGVWLHSIRSPTFVFEGADQPGNFGSLNTLQRLSKNPLIRFHGVPGANHFSVLGRTNQLVASKVLKDDGSKMAISFTDEELSRLFR